jgi:hypothetical protein
METTYFASDLKWAPGFWPTYTFLGGVKMFRGTKLMDGDRFDGFVYVDTTGTITMTVHND